MSSYRNWWAYISFEIRRRSFKIKTNQKRFSKSRSFIVFSQVTSTPSNMVQKGFSVISGPMEFAQS